MSNRNVAQCNIWEHQVKKFILWARTASWMAVQRDTNHGYEILRLYKLGTNTTVVYYQRLDGSITSNYIGKDLVNQFNEEKEPQWVASTTSVN